MKIFDDNGYLLPEFINPNYRGNWSGVKLSHLIKTYCKKELVFEDRALTLIAVSNGFLVGSECCHIGTVDGLNKNIYIPKFTPKDIPVGELCWVKINGKWMLVVMQKKCSEYGFYCNNNCYIMIDCVPYLIAETAEDAERLKNWSSDEND